MSESLHIVCPHCSATNRIPLARRQEAPKCGKCHTSLFDGKPLEVGPVSFVKHLQRNDIPLLVDFWAPWCGPCRIVGPILEELAGEYGEDVVIAKVNTDQNPIYAQRLGVQGIPTMVLFKGGTEIDRVVGALPKANLKQWIDSSLSN